MSDFELHTGKDSLPEDLARIKQLESQVAQLQQIIAASQLEYVQFFQRVEGVVTRMESRLHKMLEDNPDLLFVKNMLMNAQVLDPVEKLHAIIQAFVDVLLHFQDLLNPMRLPIKMTPDGRLLTQRFEGVATLITDIRGFTELTRHVKEKGLDIFDVLSSCYFRHVREVLDRNQCHYLNFTGDGLVILSMERQDAHGRKTLPAADNLVIATLDLVSVTESIAEAWRQIGLLRDNGDVHETGFGISTDVDLSTGDPLVCDREDFGTLLQEFDAAFAVCAERRAPQYIISETHESGVRSVQAISDGINAASRLESLDKKYPGHTAIMSRQDVDTLCPSLRALFVTLGKEKLRGVSGEEEVEIMGILRHEQYNIPRILEEALRYYEENGVPDVQHIVD